MEPFDGEFDTNNPFNAFRLSPLEQSAMGMHEMYSALVKVGFEPNQALYLTAKLINLQSGIDTLLEDGE